MGKSKLTLIVDGNWLLMSRLSVMDNRFLNNDDLPVQLSHNMLKSVNIILKTFTSIDNIIFVADGGSWRNDIPVIDYLKKDGVEYKGNRVKDERIDWDMVFNVGFKLLLDTLENNGIKVCREGGVEGDDWCWYWSRKLNADGTNVIIWSRDKDLTQLVSRDKNGCFTVCWENKSGLTCLDKEEDDMDFFFNMDYSNNDTMFNMIASKSVSINKIKPYDIIINKIVRGDAGDNILPIILKESKGDTGRKYKVAEKDLPPELDITDDKEIRTYIHTILNMKSYKGNVTKSEQDIYEHFIYNRTLVWLNRSNYPDDIYALMESHGDYTPNRNITEALQQIESKKQHIDDVLDMI